MNGTNQYDDDDDDDDNNNNIMIITTTIMVSTERQLLNNNNNNNNKSIPDISLQLHTRSFTSHNAHILLAAVDNILLQRWSH